MSDEPRNRLPWPVAAALLLVLVPLCLVAGVALAALTMQMVEWMR